MMTGIKDSTEQAYLMVVIIAAPTSTAPANAMPIPKLQQLR